MSDKPQDRTVELHGEVWRLSELGGDVARVAQRTWTHKTWAAQSALVHNSGGYDTAYTGQSFDPAEFHVVEDGWDHDHCLLCFWKLWTQEGPEHAVGYTDGQSWLCVECFEKLIAPQTKS